MIQPAGTGTGTGTVAYGIRMHQEPQEGPTERTQEKGAENKGGRVGRSVLHEESFGTRNEFGPSVLSRHHFREVMRWDVPASNGNHDLEDLNNERLD